MIRVDRYGPPWQFIGAGRKPAIGLKAAERACGIRKVGMQAKPVGHGLGTVMGEDEGDGNARLGDRKIELGTI